MKCVRKYNGRGSCEIDTSVINLTISQSKSAETKKPFAHSWSVSYSPNFMQQHKECCSYTKRNLLFWHKDGFYDFFILSEQGRQVKNIPSFPLLYWMVQSNILLSYLQKFNSFFFSKGVVTGQVMISGEKKPWHWHSYKSHWGYQEKKVLFFKQSIHLTSTQHLQYIIRDNLLLELLFHNT